MGSRTESSNTEGTIADKATVNALFTSHRSITAERALLKKNQSYYFNEILKLTDGDPHVVPSVRLSFYILPALGPSGQLYAITRL